MPPFGINPPQPIDFRYPGVFNLNQTAKLPDKFGPPDMSQQFQSGLSALADPIVSAMKESQTKTDAAKSAADYLTTYKTLWEKQQAAANAVPPVSPAPGVGAANAEGSPAGDGGGTMGGSGTKLAATNPQVRDTFMNTVKSGGLENPYALAAVAAYGQRESGWSSGNINRTWQDGPNRSGGALSWNGSRLRNMQAFVAGSEDPVAAQAQFFLQENPRLIAALNNASSPEEANKLMANAWRFVGYNQPGGGEFQARLNLTRAYVNRMGTAAPAPQAAPTASFAPQVAPAATPAAASGVTAPSAPQQPQPQAPKFTQPNVNMLDYQKAIAAALNRNDHATARELAQERDMVEQQAREAAQPQPQAPAANMPLPRRGGAEGGQWPSPGQTQAPQPQAPQPQVQAPQQPAAGNLEQGQQDQQTAQQQQVIGNVAQAAEQQSQRLDDTRQQGQRMRVASLDPSIGISPQLPGGLGGAGQQQPGQIEQIFNPRVASLPPPGATVPNAGAGAPAGTTAGPGAPPPASPAVAPAAAPIQVAQAAGLPPAVSGQTRSQIDPAMAAVLLRNARTPEEVNRIGAALLQSLQPPAPSGERFQIIHDGNGNWVRLDRMTGQATPMPASGKAASTKGADTVEIETPQGKRRFQWNPANQRYDIPIGADGQPTSGPPSKEVREAERQLFNDFESTETIKKYRELEQSVQGLKAAFSSGNANADLIAIIQLFKTIDPGSTVTGAESASVKNAAGVPETLRALFNKGWGEGGQFSPALRAEIFNTAQRLQQGRVLQVEQHAQAYRNRAKAYGLDPDRSIAFAVQVRKNEGRRLPRRQERGRGRCPVSAAGGAAAGDDARLDARCAGRRPEHCGS